MDFKKTEEQELLLESLDEFLDSCGYDDAYFKKCYDEHRIPTEFTKALFDAGFGMLGIPEAFGGTEVDLQTMVMVTERLTERGFDGRIMATALQVDDILTFGNEEQQKIVFDYLMENGGTCFCLGITEPNAGSDNNQMTASATHKDGKVILNGHKCFITNALEAQYILFLCREADVEGNPISMYFVPTNAPGVTMSPMDKIGNKCGSMCEVYVENVELPDSSLVGEMGKGFLQLMKNFEIERLVIAAQALGNAKCAYNDAAAYANQRVQFGKPIGSFQLIQEMIVEMYTKILNMQNLVYYTAWRKDNGMSVRVESSIAKYYCARAGFEVCDDAMQVMGGIGYTEEHRISRLWRDVRMHRIGGGTDQIMIHTAGRQILKQFK